MTRFFQWILPLPVPILPDMIKPNGNNVANVNTWNNNISAINIEGSCTPFRWFYDSNNPASIPAPFNPNFVQPQLVSNSVDCSNIPDGNLATVVVRIINDSIKLRNFYRRKSILCNGVCIQCAAPR